MNVKDAERELAALEQKSVKQALRASDEELRAIFDQVAVGIAIADQDGRIIKANQKFCDILGYSMQDIQGVSILDITHPDDMEDTGREVHRLLAGEIGHYCLEKRYLRKDGRPVWSRTTVTLVKKPSGAADRFIGVIEDIGDQKRLEQGITRGTLELRPSSTYLASVVEAAIETAHPLIDQKMHTLAVELPPEPVSLVVDPMRMAQVLSNLLANAAKYTDPGGTIHLKAQRDRDQLMIVVSDSGIGIPADALEGVFEMFSQVKSSQDCSDGGLGIGLALTKGLVELHGGTISAHSAGSDRGSQFIVRVPLRQLNSAPSPHLSAPDKDAVAPPRRILVADDNRDAAESLAMLLQLQGHEVTVVHDGRRAMEACRRLQPDAALLDVGMPHMTGYEVAQQVRSMLGDSVLLIAITGWGKESDKAQAMEAGFNHHFTKPVDPDRITELLHVSR